MNNYPIFFAPIFKEALWGGENLKNKFNYNIQSKNTSEVWILSANNEGNSIVVEGECKGKTLKELWENHRDIFSDKAYDKFPLLIKLLDVNKDLSVQVHPDDYYARLYENESFGKSEAWYVISCKENASIILGHKAKTMEELKKLVLSGKWKELLREIPIKKGDFFYVPQGTIHALKGGAIILEIQQNSNITYRFYDYDRKDLNGNLRKLHLEKALDVIKVPFEEERLIIKKEEKENLIITKYISNELFNISKWSVDGKCSFETPKSFFNVTVLEGMGEITIKDESLKYKKGENFIIPRDMGKFTLSGKSELMVCNL